MQNIQYMHISAVQGRMDSIRHTLFSTSLLAGRAWWVSRPRPSLPALRKKKPSTDFTYISSTEFNTRFLYACISGAFSCPKIRLRPGLDPGPDGELTALSRSPYLVGLPAVLQNPHARRLSAFGLDFRPSGPPAQVQVLAIRLCPQQIKSSGV